MGSGVQGLGEQVLRKIDKSLLHGFVFLAVSVVLCYALIMLLRVTYLQLADIGLALENTALSPFLSLIQAGLASFGLAMFLAMIFALLEVMTTGRTRIITSYGASFMFLFVSFALFAAAVSLFDAALAPLNIKPLWQFTNQSHSPLAAYVAALAYFFVADILLYWVHRLEHKNKFLWHFHAIHHAVEDLDSVSGAFHPLSNVIRWSMTILPLKFIMSVDLNSALVLAAFLNGLHFMQHTRAPFDFGPFGAIFGDNRFHFVHHSKDPRYYDKNYAAMFPVIDMIFGTYQRPSGDRLPDTGLSNKKGPTSLWAFLTGKL